MKLDNILASMQEADEGLNTLHALADMAEAVSAGKPDDPHKDYLKHMALMVHSVADDIEIALGEAAAEMMAAKQTEVATA